MSPPIPKDWWVAAALTGAALPAAMGQPATTGADRRPAAVVTTATIGQRQARPPIYIESARGQKLTTGANETMHVLFSDQSAITVGPNSEVVIAEYRYDTQSKDGNILIDLSKGLLRVVGGFISKKSETQVRTSTATIGIRGGIAIIRNEGNSGSATFLFGQQMRATDNNGNGQTITRPGFGSSFGSGGVSSPQRVPPTSLTSFFQTGGGGGGGGGGQSGGTLPTGGSTPGQLSNDRLPDQRNSNNPANQNPSQTLRDILGSGQTPNQS